MFYKLFLTIPFASVCTAGMSQTNEKHNIVYVLLDDLAYDAIESTNRYPFLKTPNIDRLQSEGITFDNFFCTMALSSPSRSCMLTGMYPHKHGVTQNDSRVDANWEKYPPYSSYLQKAGYETAFIGKMHQAALWDKDQVRPGFDYWLGFRHQGDYFKNTLNENGKEFYKEGYITDVLTDYAINWLDKRDKKKPFCLLVHHKAPHRNFMPESKYYDLYEDSEFPYPDNFFDDYTSRGPAAKSQQMSIMHDMTMGYDLKVNELNDNLPPHLEWSKADWEKARARMTPKQLQAWDAAYGPRNKAMLEANLSAKELAKWKYQRYIKDYMRTIKSVDDQIGRLLDYLEENKLMDNTIIVYTSDQGFYMGEHGWFDKRFMYEESFRTPLLIMYPKMIKAGSVCNELVQNIDYAPTYLALAGVESPVKMDGRSLVPLFSGDKPQEWRENLYYHYYDYPAIHMVRRHDGVFDGRYKLIHFYGEGKGKDEGADIEYFELYDLLTDPHEMKNVYNDTAYKEHADRLRKELHGYQQDLDIVEGNLNLNEKI